MDDLIFSMRMELTGASLPQRSPAFRANRTETIVPSMDTGDIVQVPTIAAANRGNIRKISRHGHHIQDDDRRYQQSLGIEEEGARKPSANKRLVAARI